jgi:hypothetical protein
MARGKRGAVSGKRGETPGSCAKGIKKSKEHAGIRKYNAHVKQLLPRNRHFTARGIAVQMHTTPCTRKATNGLRLSGTHPVILLDVADDAVAEPAHFLQRLVPLLREVRHPQQAAGEPWSGRGGGGG